MKCLSCNAELPATAAFCSSCGTPVDFESTPTMTHVGPREKPPAPVESPRTQRPAPKSNSPSSARSAAQDRYVAGETLAERYRIVAALGKGGMGEVYRAEDLKLGQNVALKFLPLAMMQNEEACTRFHQEVRLAREIAHPNICRVFDIGEVDGRLFLTMEYVDGEDLASLLRRIGRLPQDKALDIARQMCAGIAAAHSHGVLHRDIKPANIMLDGRGRVRITDFGLASLTETPGATEIRVGTPAYMAPEQFAGTETTARSDIYSLGLVLYEVFTGKKVFDAATLPELLRLRESNAPSSLSSVVPDIDPLIERVILRCLEKDPAKRPATALQVSAALPGGDPLAAALAAGETPSPEMVAAAGEKEGLRPGLAWVCLLLTLLGLMGTTLLADKLNLIGVVPLPNSPEVLAAKSREILRQLGYSAPPTDSTYGFAIVDDYLGYVTKQDQSKSRWKNLVTGVPPVLAFWYRQSPQFLESSRFAWAPALDPDDPPNSISGMVQMFLDPEGRLIELEAVPPQLDTSTGAPPATNWAPLFATAGLDMNAFHSVSPQWAPLLTSDTRVAWQGNWLGHQELSLRVEAASYRGKVVYFDLKSPWSKADRMGAEESTLRDNIGNGILILVLFVVLLSGIRLALRNLRTGRADRRGAFRLSLFAFLLTWSGGLMFAHHVPTTHELLVFWISTGWGLIAGMIVWLLYLAIESHVRRRWPNSLISWSRVLAGQWRDAVVGRDLLVGIVVGIYVSNLQEAANLAVNLWGKGAPAALNAQLDYIELLGLRFTMADIFLNVIIFVFGALAFFLVFFLFRVLLRNNWLAGAVLLVLVGGPGLLGDRPVFSLIVNALLLLVRIFILTRFGLFALVVTLVLNNILVAYPLTPHLSAWYAQPTILVLLLLFGAAVFSFYTSTAGRRIFGQLSVDS